MCGIAGEFFIQGSSVADMWVRQACQIMAHRGPDGEGLYADAQDSGVALGHRRLSIIDLAGGTQPMSYGNGRYWITFNGEIYNYRDLRSELASLGYPCSSASDTEVILAAFAAWGVESFQRLVGIFAFGIWDCEAQRLVIARDHLGVKPLLYHRDETGLRFASELKTLLAHPRVSRAINPEALQDYLSLGYVLTPRTIIQDVYKLPPGSYLSVSQQQVECHTYWDLAAAVQSGGDHTPEHEQIEQFASRFAAAVDQQMVSDVPLGAFLSGGVDSASIVYAAQQMRLSQQPPLKTFSIGFEEASYSELDEAQFAANALSSDHYTQTVHSPSLESLQKLAWYYDEPLGDTSIIPTYFVSQLARQHVTVTLSGDGADELLAGYDTYLADRFQSLYSSLPRWAHERVVQPLSGLIPSSYRKVSLDFKIKQFIANAYATPEQAHFGWRSMFTPGERLQIAGADVNGYSPFEQYAAHYADVPDAPALSRAQYVDIKTWLADDILPKVDRASMACSLEARVPFLSPDFVEFVLRLPPSLRMKGTQRKYVLKKAMHDKLPQQILTRKKRGFNSPITLWMRNELRQEIDDIFQRSASTIVDLHSPVLQTIWQDHCTGRVDHGYKLWTLLSLILWENAVYHGQ